MMVNKKVLRLSDLNALQGVPFHLEARPGKGTRIIGSK